MAAQSRRPRGAPRLPQELRLARHQSPGERQRGAYTRPQIRLSSHEPTRPLTDLRSLWPTAPRAIQQCPRVQPVPHVHPDPTPRRGCHRAVHGRIATQEQHPPAPLLLRPGCRRLRQGQHLLCHRRLDQHDPQHRLDRHRHPSCRTVAGELGRSPQSSRRTRRLARPARARGEDAAALLLARFGGHQSDTFFARYRVPSVRSTSSARTFRRSSSSSSSAVSGPSTL